MSDGEEFAGLPSPFYRVAVKVLVMDDQNRLLVLQSKRGVFEIPGGGWEHDEPLEDCVRRELEEEVHATVVSVSDIQFVLRGRSRYDWRTMRIVVRATIEPGELKPDDDIVDYQFVDRTDFLQLKFDSHDEEFPGAVDKIWPAH